jgi:L-lactate dehydrogenase complex protein LldG
MQESTNKEKVLKRLRKAILHKTKNPFPVLDHESPVFPVRNEPGEIIFGEKLTEAGGHFLFCENKLEFAESLISLAEEKGWKNFFCTEPAIRTFLDELGFPYSHDRDRIENSDVGITLCECLISRIGAVVISSRQLSGRKLAALSSVHVVVAYTSQIIPDIKDIFPLMKSRYEGGFPSMLTVITGPSRTADIERTIVFGAHGPRELFVFLIDDTVTP